MTGSFADDLPYSIFFLPSTSTHYAGCPVVGRSCNVSSSVPEENNVLAIEVAYTPTECSGIGTVQYYVILKAQLSCLNVL